VHRCAQPDAVGVHGAQDGVPQRRPPQPFVLRRSALVQITLPVSQIQVRKVHQLYFQVVKRVVELVVLRVKAERISDRRILDAVRMAPAMSFELMNARPPVRLASSSMVAWLR
jgi:hypothetical protein